MTCYVLSNTRYWYYAVCIIGSYCTTCISDVFSLRIERFMGVYRISFFGSNVLVFVSAL